MKKRAFAIFIVTLFVLPTSLSFVTFQNETNPDGLYLQKETQDFVTSEDSDPQNITSFSETLIDEVKYYPDALLSQPYFATGGDTGFNNTYAVDGVDFHPVLGDEILEIEFENINKIEYISWAVYGVSSDHTALWYSTDGESWDDWFVDIQDSEEWYNGTVYDVSDYTDSISFLPNTGIFYIYFDFFSYIDYLEISFGYMTLAQETDILTGPQFAIDGDTGYSHTYEVDDSYFSPVLGTEILEFEYGPSSPIEYFNYSVYGNSTDYVALYYADDNVGPWTEYFVLVDDTTLDWYNGTEYDVSTLADISTSGTFYVYFDFMSNIDYISISFCYAVLGNNSYAESFADISEWSLFSSTAADEGIGTDGDVAEVWSVNDAHPNVVVYEADIENIDLSTANYYIEYAAYTENTSASRPQFYFLYSDASTRWFTSILEEDMRVNKQYCADTTKTVNKLMMVLNSRSDAISGNSSVYFDYVRIGISEEMGWQDDCSTIERFDEWALGNNCTVSSDGDKVNITTAGTTGNYALWYFDSTSTESYMDLEYYPFIEFSISRVNYGGAWYMRVFNATDYEDIAGSQGSPLSTTGIFRYNVGSTSLDMFRRVGFYAAESGDWLTLDYVKLFNIANYTVTQSSTTIDDILYVEDGILHSYMDDGYFILDQDPTISISDSYSWEKHTTLGESYLSFLYGAWSDYSSETTGDFPYGTITTDFRIKFNETANIQKIEYYVLPPQWVIVATAIIYFDMPNWWVIGVAGSVFYIPIGEFTIQFLLMIMGLVMIPFSTVFLVKGGKDELNRDKLFLFLMIFFMGWALVLGGLI